MKNFEKLASQTCDELIDKFFLRTGYCCEIDNFDEAFRATVARYPGGDDCDPIDTCNLLQLIKLAENKAQLMIVASIDAYKEFPKNYLLLKYSELLQKEECNEYRNLPFDSLLYMYKNLYKNTLLEDIIALELLYCANDNREIKMIYYLPKEELTGIDMVNVLALEKLSRQVDDFDEKVSIYIGMIVCQGLFNPVDLNKSSRILSDIVEDFKTYEHLKCLLDCEHQANNWGIFNWQIYEYNEYWQYIHIDDRHHVRLPDEDNLMLINKALSFGLTPQQLIELRSYCRNNEQYTGIIELINQKITEAEM